MEGIDDNIKKDNNSEEVQLYENAREEYKKNIVNNFRTVNGQSWRIPWDKKEDRVCIGSACSYAKKQGVDVPLITGNEDFWSKSERGQYNMEVYHNPKKSLEEGLKKIDVGDFIGWHQNNTNKQYPNHSQIIKDVKRDKNGNVISIDVIDGYGGYKTKTYNMDWIKSTPSYMARPTKIKGFSSGYKYVEPEKVNARYIPDNLKDTISDLGMTINEEELNKYMPAIDWNKPISEQKTVTTEDINRQNIARKNLQEMNDTLVKYKEQFIMASGINNSNYDQIASILPGIAMQETKLGTVLQAPKGLNEYTRYFKEKLARNISSDNSDGILQVKHSQLFKDKAATELLNKLGITKDNYDPSNVKMNTLMAMVLFNDIDKTSLKNWDGYKTNTKRVNSDDITPDITINNKNANLSYKEKMTYLYNNPKVVRHGQAQGKSTYLHNVLEYSNMVKPSYYYNNIEEGVPAFTMPNLVIKPKN